MNLWDDLAALLTVAILAALLAAVAARRPLQEMHR